MDAEKKARKGSPNTSREVSAKLPRLKDKDYDDDEPHPEARGSQYPNPLPIADRSRDSHSQSANGERSADQSTIEYPEGEFGDEDDTAEYRALLGSFAEEAKTDDFEEMLQHYGE